MGTLEIETQKDVYGGIGGDMGRAKEEIQVQRRLIFLDDYCYGRRHIVEKDGVDIKTE